MLWPSPFILVSVDKPLHLPWREMGFIEFQRPDGALDQAELIVRIQNLEGLRQTSLFPVGAQKPMGDAMKSADPHGPERHAKQVLDPLAHLARSLVGEGHRHDAER